MKNKLTEAELSQIVQIHLNSIKDGFLSQLGYHFLYLLYESINESKKSFILVSYKNGNVIGFVSAGLGLKEIYYNLISKPFKLFKSLYIKLLNPITLLQLFRIIVRVKYTTNQDFKMIDAELYSLAVNEDYRREGVAAELYKSLCIKFDKMCVNKFLILVGNNLDGAHKFYKSSGALEKGILYQGKNKYSTIFVHKISDKEFL